MNRQQWIIVVAAIALVVILFSLPKVLLNKEEKELENLAAIDKEQQIKEPEKEHGRVNLSLTESNKTKYFIEKLGKSDLNESKSLLDSLSEIYNNKGLYDSSAFYTEKFLGNTRQPSFVVFVGDATYKAYYFATDESEAKEWAVKTRKYYQQALDKEPGLLDVKARLAMTYTKSDNPMKAVLTLREVLEKDPENEQALLNIGLLSVQSGQFDKAVERFKKLLTVNKNHWLGMFYLGIAYNELGKKELAKECFEKVKANEKEEQIREAADQYLKQLSINP